MIEFYCLSKDHVVQQYSWDAYYVLVNSILGPKDRAVGETNPLILTMELTFLWRQIDDE